MQWSVSVAVALLNAVWIVLFLQPDPWSVSVRRRSSDSPEEEILFGEFCIRPQSDINWTSAEDETNNSSTAADVPDFDSGHFDMNQQPQKSLILDEIQRFSTSSVSDETTPAGPPVSSLTSSTSTTTSSTSTTSSSSSASSEVTTASQLVSTSSSQAAHVTVTPRPTAPVQWRVTFNVNVIKNPDRNHCCLKFFKGRIPLRFIKESHIIFDPFCHPDKPNIIVITVKGRRLCIDPSSALGQIALRKSQ